MRLNSKKTVKKKKYGADIPDSIIRMTAVLFPVFLRRDRDDHMETYYTKRPAAYVVGRFVVLGKICYNQRQVGLRLTLLQSLTNRG